MQDTCIGCGKPRSNSASRHGSLRCRSCAPKERTLPRSRCVDCAVLLSYNTSKCGGTRCGPCHRARVTKPSRVCACGAPISVNSKRTVTRCRPCSYDAREATPRVTKVSKVKQTAPRVTQPIVGSAMPAYRTTPPARNVGPSFEIIACGSGFASKANSYNVYRGCDLVGRIHKSKDGWRSDASDVVHPKPMGAAKELIELLDASQEVMLP